MSPAARSRFSGSDGITGGNLKQRCIRLGLDNVSELHRHIPKAWIGALDEHGNFEVHGHPVFTNDGNGLLISNGSGRNGLRGTRPSGGYTIQRLRPKILGLHLSPADPRALGMWGRTTVIMRGIGWVQRHFDGG